MPGILPTVDTLVAAVADYDVDRPLTMGIGAALEFWTPDATAMVQEPLGLRLVRRYEQSFNRDTDAERERGDGKSLVFRIADYGFPEGQLREDLAQKSLYLVFFNTPNEGYGFYEVNKVERPAESEAQIYTVIAQTRTFKQKYRGRA